MHAPWNANIQIAQQVGAILETLLVDAEQAGIRHRPIRLVWLAAGLKDLVRRRQETDARLLRLLVGAGRR